MVLDPIFNNNVKRLPIVVAELGARYTSLGVMKRMIRSARACGADMVKFQTYQAETISTPGSFFTMQNGLRISQFDFFKRYELSRRDHEGLIRECRRLRVPWCSTPSHPADVRLLESFNPPCYKTGSDDLTNLTFLQFIARLKRPMIVSTGMCTLKEIEAAVKAIRKAGNSRVVLLHCVVSYPSRAQDANLRVMETLRREFGLPVGLSDHTRDELTSVLATQMGAVMIEKHFTLDHALKLPDDEASLDPPAFARLVRSVRLVGPAMGDGKKRILPTEQKWRKAARKSIYSARPIPKGRVIRLEDLAIRRPSDGLHPHEVQKIVGKRARSDIPGGCMITRKMF